jgi:hypothetical protein
VILWKENMKPRSDTAALLWLGLVMCVTLAIAFLLPVTPQDYWWYLRIGRDILTTGSIPQVDALSSSQAGTPVFNLSWGAAVLFWLIYKFGGLTFTLLLRGLLVTLAYSLVWRLARGWGAGRLSASLMLLLAVLATSNNWSIRPQLFAYPLFTLALYLLYRWHNGDRKAIQWLPLISLFWVNLHGSFILLILLAGAALVFGRGNKRHLSLSFAGILLATLINPRGPGAWTYAYDLLTLPAQQFSSEWFPPVNNGWQMNIFFIWFLAFPFLAAFSPRKLDPLEWTWFLGFGFLALWGERYVIWFVFLLTFLTSLMLTDWEKKVLGDPKPGSPALNITLSLLFILLPLALLPGVRNTWWQQAPSVTEKTPIAATEWLASHPELPGPLWAEIGFASYIEFALPSRPPWIDSRFVPFSVEQWEQYQAINNGEWNWQALLDEAGLNLLMISKPDQPRLLAALEASPTWCSTYQDQISGIYFRKMDATCGGN